ncbi:pyridoxal phosphate-dependent transferase [Haematococcus lacustris]
MSACSASTPAYRMQSGCCQVFTLLAAGCRVQGQASFTAVGVDAEGLVDPEAVLAAVTRDTVLVSIMHSNNEVGSLQPIAAISAGLRKAAPQVLLHTDAAQSLGKVAVDVEALGVDLLTLVGHKLGAPKGVAALWVRPGRPPLAPFLHGGSQEAGRRAGTENVLLLVGLGKAAEIARLEGAATARHMQTMRDYMQQRLVAAFPEGRVRVNGPSGPDLRLPNTLSISIAGLSAAAALVALADKLAASAGAACHSSGASLSSVLRAMGVDPTFGAGTLRLSVGRHTTLAEVERAVELIVEQAAVQGISIKQPLST